LSKRGAFEVLDRPDVFRHRNTLRVGDGRHASISEFFNRSWVFAKIELGPDKYERRRWCVMGDLGPPLGSHVLKAGRADQREADEEYVCLWVGEGSEAVVVFLSGSIPETERNRLSVHHHVCRVIVENGGDVFSWECIGGVRDQKTRFTDGTVSNNDTFNCLHFEKLAGVGSQRVVCR